MSCGSRARRVSVVCVLLGAPMAVGDIEVLSGCEDVAVGSVGIANEKERNARISMTISQRL